MAGAEDERDAPAGFPSGSGMERESGAMEMKTTAMNTKPVVSVTELAQTLALLYKNRKRRALDQKGKPHRV